MSRRTKMSADEILDSAKRYFDGSFGLSLENYNPSCCAEFTGEIGFVDIAVERSYEKMEVIVRTREWEYQVKDFLRKLK
ncbi:MAG: hypothetical protein ACW99G_10570 [Candidatus Thorarchaeota archaeon]